MSDDETPELPVQPTVEAPQSEAKSPARKSARKRAPRKTAGKAALDGPAEATAKPDAAEANPATEEASREASDKERPIKVTRISSKPGARDSEESSRDSGKGEERVAVIEEPPGSEPQRDGGKRRRRRRRRSGDSGDSNGESGSKSDLDPDLVAKKAWKIYLSEVSEEGLALINDNDARQLSQRSFKLAEIFLEESARRQ